MNPKPSRWPLVVLAIMTAFSFGGPIVIVLVVRGGTSPDWPPDRPIEWVTVIGISAVVALLMTFCLLIGRWNRQVMSQKIERPEPEQPRVHS